MWCGSKQQTQTNVTAMNFQDVFPARRQKISWQNRFAGIASQIYTDPVNATLDPITIFRCGIENGNLNECGQCESRVWECRRKYGYHDSVYITEPEITTEKMNANLFKHFEVTAPAQRWNERKNSQRRIYGIYMQRTDCSAGRNLLFNGVVGDTTAEKGYQEAAGYQMAKSSGTWRRRMPVSSTLFSLFVHRPWCGKELTIRCRYIMCRLEWMQPYSDSPDFKFENHKYPVKIV